MKTYLTEKEILEQGTSLGKVLAFLDQQFPQFREFWWNSTESHNIYTIGCGSGYCLARAGATIIERILDRPASPLAGGDLLLNPQSYANLPQDSVFVVFSRSGSTSEIIKAVERLKQTSAITVFSILAKEDSPLESLSDFSLVLPDSFDESVCQTRTVTTFYTAFLYLCSKLANQNHLATAIQNSVNALCSEISRLHEVLGERTDLCGFENAFLLADGIPFGLADEGAMAIREMSCLHASTFHVLDVRHGPMALIGERTLVIHLQGNENSALHSDLLTEIRSQGAVIVSVGPDNTLGNSANVWLETPEQPSSVNAISFIIAIQIIAFYRAISRGLNPDNPPHLNAWVKL